MISTGISRSLSSAVRVGCDPVARPRIGASAEMLASDARMRKRRHVGRPFVDAT
jgi:hypothetical protein